MPRETLEHPKITLDRMAPVVSNVYVSDRSSYAIDLYPSIDLFHRSIAQTSTDRTALKA